MHDIGHGPFSHMFEVVVKKIQHKNLPSWNHEEMSILIIGRLYNDLNPIFKKYGIEDREIQMIKDMVCFKNDTKKGEEKVSVII